MGERICSEPDCQRSARARGMCQTHYGTLYRAGKLTPLPRRPPQLAAEGERACERDGCDRKRFSRGLCAHHYGKAWRTKSLPLAAPTLPFDRHSLTNVDRSSLTAHCSICGPNTKIRLRRSRGGKAECGSRRHGHRPGHRRVRKVSSTRAKNLQRKYGLTEAEYDQMLAEQGHACAICGSVPDYRLRVDHCHATGRVRGLLCNRCNFGLGWFNDDPERMRRAAIYVA